MIVFSVFTAEPRILKISRKQFAILVESGVISEENGTEFRLSRKGEFKVLFGDKSLAWQAAEELLWEQEIEIGSLRVLIEKSLLNHLNHLHDFGKKSCRRCNRELSYLKCTPDKRRAFLPCPGAQDYIVQEVLGDYFLATYGERGNFITEDLDQV